MTGARTRRARTTRARKPAVLKAEVGKFDGEMHNVHFKKGDTVGTLFGKVSLSIGEGVSITDGDGKDVMATSPAKTNKVYYITSNYKQGK